MKIGIMSFAHTHAASYVRLLREEPDIELRAADPGPHPAASQPAASHPPLRTRPARSAAPSWPGSSAWPTATTTTS